MFREAIELTLQFVGVHRTNAGCSSAALGEFLEHDVLPFMGWTSSATLRDSVVNVALQESYPQSLLVYASPAELGEDSDAVADVKPIALSSSRTHTKGSAAARKTRPAPKSGGSDVKDEVTASGELQLVPLDTVLKLIAEDRVLWQAFTPPPSSSSLAEPVPQPKGRGRTQTAASRASKKEAAATTSSSGTHLGTRKVQLYICPTQTLRERVLGVSLHTETIRTACDFLFDVALHGYDLVHAVRGANRFGAYKSHLVNAGLRLLMRQQLAVRAYLFDTKEHITCYRIFPLYAAPLTEVEKSAAAGPAGPSTSVKQEDQGEGTHDAVTATYPWSLLQQQSSRAVRPLDHYFERKRRQSGCFPSITFDLALVKYIVQTSPDRKLLFADTLRAILGAHGINDRDAPPTADKVSKKREQGRLRKMLAWAGLRVADAFVVSRGKRRAVQVVMTADDLRQSLDAQAARDARRQHRRLLKRARQEEGAAPTADEDSAGESDGETLVMNVPDSAGKGDRRGPDSAGSHEEEEASTDSDVASDSSLSDADDADEEGASRGPSVSASGGALQRRLESADHVFYVSPDYPLALQAGREAERRPLLVTRILPNVDLDGGHRSHLRPMSRYMAQYMAQRRTLTTHLIITSQGGKAFTTVYEPLPTHQREAPPAATHADEALDAVPIKEEEDTPPPPVTSSEPDAVQVTVKPEPRDDAGASSSAAPPLPKGLSQYSVDVVLAALREAPFKALPLSQLASIVDTQTLSRRVLPHLRQTKQVYTTGITTAVRKRVGIVALCGAWPPLDDDAKKAVISGDPGGKRQPRQTVLERFLKPAAGLGGSAQTVVPTDLVLPGVPAMIDGVAPSRRAQQLTQVTPRATRYANTLMSTRNGYAGLADARAGRLHLELWRQWWRSGQGKEAPSFVLSVDDILSNMTLSTYCIVFGVETTDLVELVACAGIRWRASSEDGEEVEDTDDESPDDANMRNWVHASTAEASMATVTWRTPLHALPLALQQLCDLADPGRNDGRLKPSLRVALMKLLALLEAQHGLVVVHNAATSSQDDASAETSAQVQLCLSGSVRKGHTYHFYLPHYTATSTLLAVLQCWSHNWYHLPSTGVRGSRELCEADPDLSFPAVTALQKYMRVSLSVLGRVLYQQAGFNNDLHRFGSGQTTQRWRLRRALARRERQPRRVATAGGASSSMSLQKQHTTTMATVRRSRAPGRLMRLELDAVDVAESVAEAFHSTAPQRRLNELVVILDRGRRNALATHPLHLPSNTRGSFPTHSQQTLRISGEHAMHIADMDAATYNPLLRTSTLHLATLGRTLNAVRDAHVRAPAWWAASRQAGAASAATAADCSRTLTGLKRAVYSVLQPNLLAVDDACAETPPNEGNDAHRTNLSSTAAATPAQISARLSALEKALCSESPTSSTATAIHKDTTTTTTTAGTTTRRDLVPLSELAEDALRMILLSDRAHYSASIAYALLKSFPGSVVGKARSTLQKCPSFRAKGPAEGRVPRLGLGTNASFMPAALMTGTAQRSANMALLHALTADTEAFARQNASCPAWSPDIVRWPSTAAPLEVTLHAQATLDLNQPDEAAVIGQSVLRLPELDWPHAAAVVELERCRSRDSEAVGVADAESVPGRTSAGHARTKTHKTAPRREKETRGAKAAARSDDDGEDGEDEEHTRSQRESLAVEQQLYPARRLGAGVGASQRIPTAPAPTPEEKQAVVAALAALKHHTDSHSRVALNPPRAGLSASSSSPSCAIAYPSIFHHVDGTFHPFVWQMFLTTLFRYVQYVPGLTHGELTARLLVTGLVSRRAAEAGIEFLVLAGVLRRTEVAVDAVRSDLAGSPDAAAGDDDAEDKDSPRRRGWTWAYHVTVPCSGMWDLTCLDAPTATLV